MTKICWKSKNSKLKYRKLTEGPYNVMYVPTVLANKAFEWIKMREYSNSCMMTIIIKVSNQFLLKPINIHPRHTIYISSILNHIKITNKYQNRRKKAILLNCSSSKANYSPNWMMRQMRNTLRKNYRNN